jgi:hypothetical protein
MLISGELTSGMVVHIEAAELDESSLDDCGIPLKKQKTHALKYRIEKDEQAEDMVYEEDTNMEEDPYLQSA